ncbi:MAG: hypothetical protein E7172_00205 [Firmicutes bacterium]|nr:hypothetical protein [Bacillota bacterium]
MKRKYILNTLLLFFLIIIMIISLFNMYNTKLINSIYNDHFIKQIIWYLLGFIIIIIINKINLNRLFKYSFYLYLFTNILLLLVLFFGNKINGARAWFNLGFISFQPSELMKISLSLYLVHIINETKIKDFKDEFLLIFKSCIITLIPSILVFLEPDTGAIIFYLLILFSLLLLKNINKWWFLIIFLGFLIILSLFLYFYNYNQDLLINLIGTSFFYRIERIITFTNQNSYQLENALIVIGSSSFFKNGFNKGNLYIPEAPTDFIFAYNIGNFGIFCGLIVIISYFVLDIILIRIKDNIKNKKIKLFISSFIWIFLFQQIINIGMNLGLMPIIGIPLPFLSYGGSTIIIYFIYFGLIINFFNKERKLKY